MRRKKAKPLLTLTQSGPRFGSVLLTVEDLEEAKDLPGNEIGTGERIPDTMTIPLLKMTFLPVVNQGLSSVRRYASVKYPPAPLQSTTFTPLDALVGS